MTIKVFIDDNFHYMDGNERIHFAEFSSAEEAIEAAKKIVDDELEHLRSSGVAAEEIMSLFAQFGPDPFLVSDGDPVSFSARDYARTKIAEWNRDIRPIKEWFRVTFSGGGIEIDVEPPGRDPWRSFIDWKQIIRVCFRSGDLATSDEIYIFTDERPESWVVPTEAAGGIELWYEILERGLFGADIAIQAASATNELFCWPEN